MFVKCPFCGKQKNVDKIFGSPLCRCDVCEKIFYDERIKEPALYPPPVNKMEQLGFFTYSGLFIGAGFLMFGFFGMLAGDMDLLPALFAGLLATAISGYLILSAYRDKNKREECYQKLLKESQQKLSDFSYQKQLIVASNGNEQVVSLLQKYNSSHHADFIIDVDDILNDELNKK